MEFSQFSFDRNQKVKIRNPYPDEKLRNHELYHMKRSRFLTKNELNKIQRETVKSLKIGDEKADLAYISIDEFLENFSDEIAVCFYDKKNWLSSRLDYILDDGRNLQDLAFFEVKITKNGNYYFGISQPEIDEYRFLKISIFEVRYKFGKISNKRHNNN